MAKVELGLDDSQLKKGLANSSRDIQTWGKGISGTVSGLSGALATLGAGVSLGGLIQRGLEFNKNMADSEVAISNVLAHFQGLNQEAAKNEAAKAMKQIIELEPRAAGSLSDLTGGFMATVGVAQSLGISVADNIDLVGRFANALSNAKIPAEQLAQEMRSILTGNIGADSTLAKTLNITNEDVKKWREQGDLVDKLREKLGKFADAGDTAEVAISSLNSAIDKALGAATKGLFDESVSGAKTLTESINENQQAFADLGAGVGFVLGGITSTIGEVDKAIRDLTGGTMSLVSMLPKMFPQLSGMGLIGDISKIIKGTEEKPTTAEPTGTQVKVTKLDTLPGLEAALGENNYGMKIPGLDAASSPERLKAERLKESEEMSKMFKDWANPAEQLPGWDSASSPQRGTVEKSTIQTRESQQAYNRMKEQTEIQKRTLEALEKIAAY